MAQQIKLRRDTAAHWTTANPVLAQGEPGLETDTKKFKIGDGTTAWAALAYAPGLNFIPTAVKTADYTAVAADFVPVDTTSGNVTVTLPSAPADGTVVAVKQVVRGGTNTVSLTCAGSDHFNTASGPTTATLTVVNQGIVLQYKSSTAVWFVVADDLPLSQLDNRFAGLIVIDGGSASSTFSAVPVGASYLSTTQIAADAALTSVYAQRANNLSDVTASAARTNLGLAVIAASGSANDLVSGTVPLARMSSVSSGYVSGKFYRWLSSANAQATISAVDQTFYCARKWFPTAVSMSQLGLRINSPGSGSSLCRVMLYSDSSGYPGALLQDLGTFAGTPAGENMLTCGQSIAAGTRLWAAALFTGAPGTAPQFVGIQTNQLVQSDEYHYNTSAAVVAQTPAVAYSAVVAGTTAPSSAPAGMSIGGQSQTIDFIWKVA